MILNDIKAALKAGLPISEKDKDKLAKHNERVERRTNDILQFTIQLPKTEHAQEVVDNFNDYCKLKHKDRREVFLSIMDNKGIKKVLEEANGSK